MANTYNKGAVSIFAVIFSTLLLTVLTVSFMGLMISAQQRAINNDLSQSAYDSALAGVEDAKRVVRACANDNDDACSALEAASDCQVVARAKVNGSVDQPETVIASNSSSGQSFDQAYTCVNIDMDSVDYLFEAQSGRAHIVPLRATQTIKKITIEWFTLEDNNNAPARTPTSSPASSTSLPPIASWNSSAPSLIRAQLITPGESFSLSSLDESSSSRTLFLRPANMSSGSTSGMPTANIQVSQAAQPRATSGDGSYSNSVSPVVCSSNYANNGFSCSVTLDLADDQVISTGASNNALLRVDSLYKGANVRVTLHSQDGSEIKFDDVQPVVDSTGRASTLFRRVEARLRMGTDFPYPSYVADVQNNLCKNFSVYDTGFISAGCNP